MVIGQELLHLQIVGLDKTDQEMADLMAVPLELYMEWVSPNSECAPPVKMVMKVAKLVDGDVNSSLLECERTGVKNKLYQEGEVLGGILNNELDACDDEDVPLHQEKVNILQRLISGMLTL
jgi:hypothetical protein